MKCIECRHIGLQYEAIAWHGLKGYIVYACKKKDGLFVHANCKMKCFKKKEKNHGV